MKLLIVAATFPEIAPTIAHFNLATSNFIETETFDILITGVGMVATSFALGQKLSRQYQLILNVGIAGSFDKTIELGEVINVRQDIFSEMGAEDHDNFISLPQLGLGSNSFASTVDILDHTPLKAVKGITVNKVHGNAQSIENITQLYQPQIESMEGAAFFFAAEQLNIPALQIRSISNYVEPRNREHWQIGLAITNLNCWLIPLLKRWPFEYRS